MLHSSIWQQKIHSTLKATFLRHAQGSCDSDSAISGIKKLQLCEDNACMLNTLQFTGVYNGLIVTSTSHDRPRAELGLCST